ncbi:MAG: hypothetical protein L0Y66_21305 [Myxococcaceae bacterium]|nr:hypothetical protein [Myxococcaceae bacterium]MCI0671177.1 hypothetical protein [Myxococcaceae bacterium]
MRAPLIVLLTILAGAPSRASVNLGVRMLGGYKHPLNPQAPGRKPGLGPGVEVQGAVGPWGPQHWFMVGYSLRTHPYILTRSRFFPLWTTDHTLWAGYEVRLLPHARVTPLLGGSVGFADEMLCGGFDCVGGWGLAPGIHGGARATLGRGIGLEASVRTRLSTAMSPQLFLQAGVGLSVDL